jgi:hypothetical protein
MKGVIMAKKIVVLMGSPRPHGNTDTLADAFIKGAEASGNEITKFNLNTLKINYCKDCKYCSSHDGECSQKDGMTEIYHELYQADMVVFASPIYFYGLSAQIKTVIDRLFTMTGKSYPITTSILLSPFADTDITVKDPIVMHFKAISQFMGWEVKGIITVPQVDQKGDIIGNPSLEEAEKLGQSIS